MVDVLRIERHAEVLIESGCEVTWSNRSLLDCATIALAGSDNLAMSQAATGQAHRHNAGPWSRPSVLPWVPMLGVRPNSPIAITNVSSNFPLAFQIADQCGQQMVEERQQRLEPFRDSAVGWNVVAMVIPSPAGCMIAEVESDEGDAGFD